METRRSKERRFMGERNWGKMISVAVSAPFNSHCTSGGGGSVYKIYCLDVAYWLFGRIELHSFICKSYLSRQTVAVVSKANVLLADFFFPLIYNRLEPICKCLICWPREENFFFFFYFLFCIYTDRRKNLFEDRKKHLQSIL